MLTVFCFLGISVFSKKQFTYGDITNDRDIQSIFNRQEKLLWISLTLGFSRILQEKDPQSHKLRTFPLKAVNTLSFSICSRVDKLQKDSVIESELRQLRLIFDYLSIVVFLRLKKTKRKKRSGDSQQDLSIL
jgi:hypothetical protein